MVMRRIWTGLVLVAMMAIPVAISQQGAFAAGAPKAEWRTGKAPTNKAKSTAKKAAAPTAQTAPEADTSTALAPAALVSQSQPVENSASEAAPRGLDAAVAPVPPAPSTAALPDQSQEVLEIDFALAATIAAQGPKLGYGSALSDEGVLYDANGASPTGKEAANSRFGTFPGDVILQRTPESALAAGGSGSSWGTYTIKRGDNILSGGRYISVWRREAAGWRMVSELAAGKNAAPAQGAQAIGVLPKRPVSMGRAAPSPIGVPLTVPTPPAAAQSETPARTP